MAKPKRQRPPPMKLIHRQTWQAACVLILAIVTSIAWNQYYEDKLSLFWRRACRISNCHSALTNKGRVHVANSLIPANTLVAKIPRSYLITESDARRSIKRIVVPQDDEDLARTTYADGSVALAVYLAQVMHGDHKLSPELQSYIDILPTNFEYHPILWNSTQLTDVLGTDSLTRYRVHRLRDMIDQEYESVSPQVHQNRSLYLAARLNVLTRSFGSSNEHAMVPILDMYDHRGSPNVQFQYHRNAYQIVALRDVQAGEVLHDSYGKRTDSDLFSKYGFVNRDGDDWMDASLGVYHDVLAESVDPKTILRYLQFDDGYETCISPENTTEWEIKKQKFVDLQSIANREKSWVIRHPPQAELPRRGLDAKGVFKTCEIITRTHETSAARTALCIVRLVNIAQQRQTQSLNVLRSEWETLQAVKIAALRSIHGMNQSEARMRKAPCSFQDLVPLLESG